MSEVARMEEAAELSNLDPQQIDRLLDLLVEINLAASQDRLGAENMLAIVRAIWGEAIEPIEYDMLEYIFKHTERRVRGEITEQQWVDDMNAQLISVWSTDRNEE